MYHLMDDGEFFAATGRHFPGLTNEQISDKNNSSRTDIRGAVSGALNPEGEEAQEHAERYYGLVRKMKTDVPKIAKVTGYSEEQIQAVKNFIFVDVHNLGGRIARFAPDYMMAQSWQRLVAGTPEPHDLTLINHEIMESQLMESGMPQDEAHIQASNTYDYK